MEALLQRWTRNARDRNAFLLPTLLTWAYPKDEFDKRRDEDLLRLVCQPTPEKPWFTLKVSKVLLSYS